MERESNRPWKVSQIDSERPNVPKTASILVGNVGSSMNGGHNKVVHYKKVMAGEKHYEYRLNMQIQMLTPLTPTFQPLYMTIRSFFVPNSRVWENAEKYTAQKQNGTEEKITEIPNMGGKTLPWVVEAAGNKYANITHTDLWRDSYISSYIPRIGTFGTTAGNSAGGLNLPPPGITMPKASILPIRGRRAIYNDFERNKEYDAELTEYKSDTVSLQEWQEYTSLKPSETNFMRAKKPNSYYTDYRTNYQGFDSMPPELEAAKSFTQWSNWEHLIAEARAEAENAQLNDWQIISKIRGSKLLTEGKVQLIGEKTLRLNYNAVTQNTYNNNENVEEQFRVMGKQGAYSYTNIDIPCYAGMTFNEEGYVHIIATVWADTVYEKAFDRNELNVTALDEYRPDLIEQKFDVLYLLETNTSQYALSNNQVLGFKRKFSEYFKLANAISGDLTSENYYQYKPGSDNINQSEQIITQATYQFYEEDIANQKMITGQKVIKKQWLDYTDLLINKNQAILNDIDQASSMDGDWAWVRGQNQIYFAGLAACTCELPIDESIRKNYSAWGEH